MKIKFSVQARKDLDEIEYFIALDNPKQALHFIRTLIKESRLITQTPFLYNIFLENSGGQIRRKVYRSYLIFYRIQNENVEILRIIHGARDINRVL